MKKLYKSTILALIPFIAGFLTYFTFPAYFGGTFNQIADSFLFTIYHFIVEGVLIFIVAYVLFED